MTNQRKSIDYRAKRNRKQIGSGNNIAYELPIGGTVAFRRGRPNLFGITVKASDVSTYGM